jgi:glutamate/tyrosine decarboxylase-like PLP-dependent enzyme
LRAHLDGLERADSFTVDAHKWLAATMGCALFITRRGSVLSDAFRATTDFMPSQVLSVDPYLNSVQWSRRFLGLRLFLALASAGWPGLGAHVERSVLVMERVRDGLVASGWTIANDSPLAVLNAIPPRRLGDVRSLVKRVVASGRAWAAATTFEGREVVRICATNGETAERDIAALLAALNAAAEAQH